jgi:uncharacterized protein (TIGR03086 family)
MEIRDFHRRATEWFGRNVRAVGDEGWHEPTPCTEWDVHDLVNHLVYECRWMPPLLEGKTIADVGEALDGDLLGQDPKGAWEAAAAEASAAVNEEGALDRIVHLSYADRTGSEYTFEVASDLFIHGWDLARATGADERMDPEIVDFLYGTMQPVMAQLRTAGVDAFGPDVTPPEGADPQTKLLALYGRVA